MNYKILMTFVILLQISKISAINYIDSLKYDDHLLRFDSINTNFTLNLDCGKTIEECSKNEGESTLSLRLQNFVAWLILRNKSNDQIYNQLNKRILSFFPEDSCKFTKPLIKPTGIPSSPVKLVAYVKASCSLCKRVVIPLHMAINSEVLKGIATLEIRPMMDSPGNRALLAAEKQGKGWDFFLALEKEERRLDMFVIKEIIKSIGLDFSIFEKDYNSLEITNTLLDLRDEATENGFNTAPTLYINNFRYQSYKDPKWLIDAIEYKYEILKGKK